MTSSGDENLPRLVLDTSAYAYFRHGHDDVLGLIAGAQVVFVPVIVLGELEGGFELGTRGKENRVALRQFLDEPFVSVLETTSPVARRYGRLFARLRRAGTPIPTNDVWIAAVTEDCGAHLVTFDQHYRHVESLDCTILPSDPSGG